MKRTAATAATDAAKKGKDAKLIRHLMDFLKLTSRLEANTPSFSKFLGLVVSNAHAHGNRFSWLYEQQKQPPNTSKSLVFRYKIPQRLKYLQGYESNGASNNNISSSSLNLSTYTSILDDVTTWGLLASSPKRPRPGVSVTMQAQRAAGNLPTHTNEDDEVEIVTTITKLGRTLGFVRAEVRNPTDHSLICHFHHTKYMPPGLVLGILLTPIGRWCLNCFLAYVWPLFPRKPTTNLYMEEQTILESYQQTGPTTATFCCGPQHSNGLGGLHGGVQAVLMERLGKTVALRELQDFVTGADHQLPTIYCERLSISYQSSASKHLEIIAHTIDRPTTDHPFVTLRIEILRGSSGDDTTKRKKKKKKKSVVVSEGIFTFSAAASTNNNTKKDQ